MDASASNLTLRACRATFAWKVSTAPYNHLKSKEHLFAAVATEGFRKLNASQVNAVSTDDTQERARMLANDYVRFALTYPQIYRLMFGVGMTDENSYPALRKARQDAFKPIREAIAAHLQSLIERNEPKTPGLNL